MTQLLLLLLLLLYEEDARRDSDICQEIGEYRKQWQQQQQQQRFVVRNNTEGSGRTMMETIEPSLAQKVRASYCRRPIDERLYVSSFLSLSTM